ncbi:IS110 family transposase [Leisingera sp. S232]|uniref:IS110 family transposase n=1 Tax=Leisingera sp. S232 TaxID=3415132 RepID=UPI003C79AB9F
MSEVTVIGVDLAKSVFQVHGAAADGTVLFRKKLTRKQFPRFMAEHPKCVVAMEACGSAYFWAREMESFGHEAKLIAPQYVKPFVRRQKNDAADAEAIAEAAVRATTRFVPVKSQGQQARSALFRTRELIVNQRTQTVNAFRAHLAEFGVVVPKGVQNVKRLVSYIGEEGHGLPAEIVEIGQQLTTQIEQLTQRIKGLEKSILAAANASETTRRLRTIPGVGPITAVAIDSFAPEMASFANGRNFSAWLGLVPLQRSTGGKQILGRTSKMGQKDIRRLLIIGAMGRIGSKHRHPREVEPWLQDKLDRKPRMVAAIALANKMARQIWAMLTKGEDYRNPIAGVAA